MSALDNATGRLAARLGRYSDQRPAPPRGIRVDTANNWVSWDPPAASEIYTHFRLWINTDSGDPHMEFPAGQRGVQLFWGTQIFLACWNEPAQLASSKISLSYNFGTLLSNSGGCSGCSGKSDVHVQITDLTASPTTVPNTSWTPCTGDQLCCKLIQDATGGRTVAWDTQFEHAPTTDIDGTPNTYSLVRFVGIDSKWVYDNTLHTGLS